MSRPGRKCGHIHAELASPAVEHQSVRVDDAEMLAQQPGAGCRQLRFDMAEMRLYPLRCIGRQTGARVGSPVKRSLRQICANEIWTVLANQLIHSVALAAR